MAYVFKRNLVAKEKYGIKCPYLSHVMLCFFGLFELVSLFENLGEVGVPLPRFITRFIERLRITLEGEE